MILAFLARSKRSLALLFLTIFYCNFILANYHSAVVNASYAVALQQYSPVNPYPTEEKPFLDNTSELPGDRTLIQEKEDNKASDSAEDKADGQLGSGPTQPEMQAFQSVNSNNMVDLFSGDFSYNIPLLDVGGYPVNISYRSGITMDQEASWVGLGWNVNPGTITRNMRGLPDDFNGTDSMTQTTTTKENKTIGVTGGTDFELFGGALNLGVSGGIFSNNYRGFGLEYGLSAALSSGKGGKGPFTGGLSLKSNSQEGVTLSPTLSYQIGKSSEGEYTAGNVSLSSGYNSRTGLKSLQLSAGVKQYAIDDKNQEQTRHSVSYDGPSGAISFAYPSYSPRITTVHTSHLYSFSAKIGGEFDGAHPNGYLTGYVSSDKVEGKDSTQRLPAYGYLNYQNNLNNPSALLDYNREKEIPYREKPYVPNIAVPSYTYDVFSITGEGIGGMFRAYRGDIGYVFDHAMKSKDESLSGSVDLGFGNAVHTGVDINVNHAYTQNGPADDNNLLRPNVAFKKSDTTYEAVYFRNPGEKSINSKSYYDAIGGDDVITANLQQNGINDSRLLFDGTFRRYANKKYTGSFPVSLDNTVKKTRDKRTQVITYLTATEADQIGYSKYLENYGEDKFEIKSCNKVIPSFCPSCVGGLTGEYFNTPDLSAVPVLTEKDTTIDFSSRTPQNGGRAFPTGTGNQTVNSQKMSIRWTGQLLAPQTGTYYLRTGADDGINLYLNDSIQIKDGAGVHGFNPSDPAHGLGNKWDTVNLVAGQYYKIKIEYFQNKGERDAHLFWTKPDGTSQIIPSAYLSIPSGNDVVAIDNVVTVEKRVNGYRKPNHISEIQVLNNDGRRYVYGIPVYNLKQKEVSFAVKGNTGDPVLGTIGYTPGVDNKSGNPNGTDNYYSSQETPAYAHSFLLTSIVSPDYIDLTGDGITEDDMGDAIKFNYTKIADVNHPYRWRTPYTDNPNAATYNERLKTDNRDDKANYVYGEKELWYLNSIESKNMVAVFQVESRKDLWPVDENGKKISTDTLAKRLKEIDLYTKADFTANYAIGKAKPIKAVHFEYSYDLCKGVNKQVVSSQDSGKLTLKRIWFSYNGNDKGKRNPYIFNYASSNPSYSDTTYDRWGNVKLPSQNPDSKSSALITNADYPYSIQATYNSNGTIKSRMEADKNSSSWTLDSIILPSGGRIKVTYESDDYAYVQNKRAMQMFKVKGFGSSPSQTPSLSLYDNSGDKLYVFAKVNKPVTSSADVFNQYLQGVDSIYFKLFVRMPADRYGQGSEYVPCYASVDKGGGYGFVDPYTIWFKLKGITSNGGANGDNSPLLKAASSFLRLNLNSKAYPGSEIGTDASFSDAIKLLAINATNIIGAFTSFDNTVRNNGWVNLIDSNRSIVRLDNPDFKKLGGGLRVKRISIYDNWNSMSANAGANPGNGQQSAVYGQEYSYTTTKQINGKQATISSGVASYEPILGGEENPWHVPIQYVEQAALLAPISLGYTEEALGENFFPSPSVGYSKVRVRSVNVQNRRSANGYEETTFFTTYDFPTLTDRTLIDSDTKKRFKPGIANFLRINAKHYLAVSQGFKVDLNDMNGKMRTQATYPETDSVNPISYTENFYKVDDPKAEFKHLSNTVWTIDPSGTVDTTSIVGKDVEIMNDMRRQYSYTLGNDFSPNLDVFSVGLPIFIGSAFHLPQQEEDIFRSVATTKVINRFGILDSVVHIENGSLVSTKNLLYDAETGDVLLTRTQNEYNDPIYNFSYPSHWAYDGMGEAYKNINAVFNHLEMNNGKITSGLVAGRDTAFFTGGDELLVTSHEKTGSAPANASYCDAIATFPTYKKLWIMDTSVVRGGPKSMYVIDENGIPFTGHDVYAKIIRSGRKNINTSVGTVTMLQNPLIKNGGSYSLQLTTAQKIINASAVDYKQLWKVNDKKRMSTTGDSSCTGVTYGACIASRPSALSNSYSKSQQADTTLTLVYDSTTKNFKTVVTNNTLSSNTLISNRQATETNTDGDISCMCYCLRQFFDYLINNHRLFIKESDNTTVGQIITDAYNAGYVISSTSCDILEANATELFYALTLDSTTNLYRAQFGHCQISLKTTNNGNIDLYSLTSNDCTYDGKVSYHINSGNGGSTINKRFNVTQSLNNYTSATLSGYPYQSTSINTRDTASDKLFAAYHLTTQGNQDFIVWSDFEFDSFAMPPNASLQTATLNLYAYPSGFNSPSYPNAHRLNSEESGLTPFYLWVPSKKWNVNSPNDTLNGWQSLGMGYPPVTTYFQDYHIDVSQAVNWWNTYGNSGFAIYYQYNYVLDTGLNPIYATFCSQKYADLSKRPTLDITYSLPATDIGTVAQLTVDTCIVCTSNLSTQCISTITDTLTNPYRAGILGNWRVAKNYVYYTDRAEKEPGTTNIRTNGGYDNFSPFWKFVSNKLISQVDTTYWVWNSESTLFNKKGFELENRDPLNRYNAGLYGYNMTLPTGVIQNGKYRQSGYDGFEDYNFTSNQCDTVCSVSYRQFDYSNWQSAITATEHHTGKYSLKINKGSTTPIALSFNTVANTLDGQSPKIKYVTGSYSCNNTTSTVLQSIRADQSALLPAFQPSAGDTMVVSAWVMEGQDCKCTDYKNDSVIVTISKSAGTNDVYIAKPSGPIVEGWQRFETLVPLSSLAISMAVSMQTNGQYDVYFDDIRMHPYHANMKSFVYDPVNLRLVAELDENNYATFYEYDDDGTLVRVKKETERGIKTIKETRSTLLKNNDK